MGGILVKAFIAAAIGMAVLLFFGDILLPEL